MSRLVRTSSKQRAGKLIASFKRPRFLTHDHQHETEYCLPLFAIASRKPRSCSQVRGARKQGGCNNNTSGYSLVAQARNNWSFCLIAATFTFARIDGGQRACSRMRLIARWGNTLFRGSSVWAEFSGNAR